jgi:hypothetical protein
MPRRSPSGTLIMTVVLGIIKIGYVLARLLLVYLLIVLIAGGAIVLIARVISPAIIIAKTRKGVTRPIAKNEPVVTAVES